MFFDKDHKEFNSYIELSLILFLSFSELFTASNLVI